MANISTSAVNHGQTQAAQHLAETSSRCVPGGITGAHNFEVTKFSLLDGAMGIGKYIASNPFSVGGYDWNIKFYPDGNRSSSSSSSPYVSVYLNLIGGAADDVRVKFSLSLLFKDCQVPRETTHTFPSTGDDWGWTEIIGKSKLRRFVRRSDDRFTIRCVLTVLTGDPQVKDDGSIAVPPPKLHQDLSHMLKNGEGADVTFSVGGQLFPAHKWMLAARSMVFKAEFFGAMKERDDQCIKIEDMKPATFEALLHFVYTDSLPGDCGDDADSSNVAMQHLLVAADRYGLDRLRVMCEEKLCWDIDVETVATTLVLAEQHHCAQLKDACLGFIASRNMFGAVMKTDGFQHLITSCPLVMKEILDKVAAAGNE